MPLVLFDLDKNEEEKSGNGTGKIPKTLRPPHVDALQVFGQLTPSQQPELRFVETPGDNIIRPNAWIAVLSPVDCLSQLQHVVDPETHYELLSKRGLAVSGLPSPKTTVIDTNLTAEVLDEALLQAEVARMIKPISELELPFVVKVTQSISGQGTFIIRTDSDRLAAEEALKVELRRMLQQIDSSNRHMHPCSLVVQEMVPGDAVAVSLFVTKKGRAIFIGCSKQAFDETTGHWSGGFISYKDQALLEEQCAGTIDALARFLHKKGYYGPIGADVMTDQAGRQLIIDINARLTGSYNLGCLKGHFVRRGLFEAVMLYPLHLPCTRDGFERAFEKELQYGSMVISAWSHDAQGKSSLAAVTRAAEDSPVSRNS